MKALVTGGAGFIGRYLITKLLKKGYYVEVLDLKTGQDCRAYLDVKRALKNTDIVFHLAAYASVDATPKQIYEHNIKGVYVILEGMRKSKTAKTIVFTSSSAVYGDRPEAQYIPLPENYPLNPKSTYGASKVVGEALIQSYCHSYGIRGVCLRLGNIVGRNCHGVIPDFINILRKNPKELPFIGDGKQTRAYTYIDDCVDAIITSPKTLKYYLFNVFNIASKDSLTVVELADIIVEEMGLSNVKYGLGAKRRIGEISKSSMDITKAKEQLKWTPEFNSKEAVRKTAEDLIVTMP